jgi:hypothetical protein
VQLLVTKSQKTGYHRVIDFAMNLRVLGPTMTENMALFVNQTTIKFFYDHNDMDAYTEAHLFVAAIRVLQHQGGCPPNLEEVCSMVGLSVELGHTLCRKLAKRGIIETFEDPFCLKLAVANHLDIETLPRKMAEENSLAKELEKFQSEKKNVEQKVATIQAELAKKRQNLFSDIEAKFKKEMEKQKKR